MNLFQLGNFVLHSGQQSSFKIECDALTEQGWETMAAVIANNWELFCNVIGIPYGGVKLASCLAKYAVDSDVSPKVLLVDDVLTTGNSMEEYKWHIENEIGDGPVIGAVVFARGKCPDWIFPVFQMRSI